MADKFNFNYRQIDKFRRRLDAETVRASSQIVMGVTAATNTPHLVPDRVGALIISTDTYAMYMATCTESSCWKQITSSQVPPAGGGGGGAVTIPTGTIAVFLMDEGVDEETFEVNYSTRVGQLLGPIVWNSTGGARGNPAPSNTATTGYISVPREDGVYAYHAGGGTVGEQTVMMCVEPRQSASGAGHPLGFWSHEDNSGSKYAYTIFQQNNNTIQSRLSSNVGAGASTFTSTAGVVNSGERNSIVARVDKAQASGSRTKMWVNMNLMSGSSTDDVSKATADPQLDLRFGLQGADPTSYSNSNMSFYVYLKRNVTQDEIDTFHEDCSALTP